MLLNAGVLPRHGPGRLTVLLSRALVDAGFAVFRFDLSGLGDSEARLPPLPVAQSIVADVREALDHLARHEAAIAGFVLGGLCAGAVSAHYAAAADPRVTGVLLLDGYSYPTFRWRLLRALDRLRNPAGLVRSLTRRLRWRGRAAAATMDGEDDFLPRWPKRDVAEADLASLVRRQVQLLYVFTGEWFKYRYEGQIRDAFPAIDFGGQLTEKRIPFAEHLYFTAPERAEMLDIVVAWMRERFSARAAPKPAGPLQGAVPSAES